MTGSICCDFGVNSLWEPTLDELLAEPAVRILVASDQAEQVASRAARERRPGMGQGEPVYTNGCLVQKCITSEACTMKRLGLIAAALVFASLVSTAGAQTCPPGYKAAAGTCVQSCPSGYEDRGQVCVYRSQGGGSGG